MEETGFTLLPMTAEDIPDVLALSDRCVGKGLYGAGALTALLARPGSECRVARTGSGALAGYCLTYLAGVEEASAVTKLTPEALRALWPGREPKVGVCKSLGTDAAFRGQGLGCRLQGACCGGLFERGADYLLGVAWRKGYHVPVQGILERLGFTFLRDVQRVWYDEAALECPYCGQTHCVCPAAIFIKRGEHQVWTKNA